MSRHVLVLGGHGSIGDACATRFERDGWTATRSTSREGHPTALRIALPDRLNGIDGLAPVDAVIWAQGVNRNDSVDAFDLALYDDLLRTNTTFVAATLHRLLSADRLLEGSRLVVLSSIWQDLARSTKLSYTVSKAALGGLVRSAAVDLAARNILINAVLPGVVDTPMTRSVLSDKQILAFERSTGAGRLVRLEEVAEVAYFLGAVNTAITGQSFAVDLGFSIGRQV